MAAGESQRLHLYEVARDRWHDDEAARTLMDLLPSSADELATKTDIAALREAMRADILERLHDQTRTLLLATITMWLSVVGLVVGLRFT